ncbi:unnamed protein product [Aphanomyces euteiches]|uniref:tetrahydrofolate synthase n=1 Tax=Aphanomyces euteiches TaxID=100861 RepID=A0A6G0XFF3_9STRA|nr:hypothetical protein Ae201684_005484 [Aphanomyces euteiches]KAH9092769.1 hypothetical protein Ae201684P_008438 [Aphanomyces euteiches]KAH9100227.1 hypothetical protein LEN26_016050 [Aphanomyces euteiches]KAH9125011.1 hypothetical protein AeMF1_004315 [Aphanomyces euteiches]KAH9139865.1 hypothetical protein AeRB84_015888 [Aphanomyces euteiches]
MTVAHKGLSDYTQEEVERFRARGIDGAMDILLGMPGRPAYVGKTSDSREVAIEMMVSYLKRLRMDISGLSIIHVAGTKGKGSTCAFTESILRAHGAKTGMFTSPHLIHPNERFRINGKPISDEIFLTNFWAVWDGLSATMNEAQGFPPIANFFRFFTLMALRMFQEERVDVVILEVGLGGRLDATNVVEKPVVCGITTLDLDHTRVLGDTLDKIAREKAGIMKSNVPVFTIAQPEIAANMLAKCSIEHNAPLVVVPPLSDFNISAHDLKHSLGMHGEYQRVNAALAIVLASTWLGAKHGTPLPPFNAIITPTILEGLKLAFWPGRSQTVVDPLSSTIFHVDGAHTPLSIECCAQWFESCCEATPTQRRIFIFNCHHERDVVTLFLPLLKLHFHHVVFCPSRSCRPSIVKIPSVEEALLKANLDIAGLPSDVFNTDAFPPQDDRMYWQFVCEKTWTILNQLHGFPTATSIFPSVEKTLEWIRETAPQDTKVLVTGSLYNVGDTLSALEWKE